MPCAENPDNELNDIDVFEKSAEEIILAYCFDSGETTVSSLYLESYMLHQNTQLKHKHSNICLKTKFSGLDPNIVYTLGFDYKIIQWNLEDNSKS